MIHPAGDDMPAAGRKGLTVHSSDPAEISYCIVVKGRLSDRYENAFGRLHLEPLAGHTALRGPIVDQAELYGVLNRLRDLGIDLVSVNAVD